MQCINHKFIYQTLSCHAGKFEKYLRVYHNDVPKLLFGVCNKTVDNVSKRQHSLELPRIAYMSTLIILVCGFLNQITKISRTFHLYGEYVPILFHLECFNSSNDIVIGRNCCNKWLQERKLTNDMT